MRRVLPWILAALAVGLVVLVRAILPADEPIAALPSSMPSSSTSSSITQLESTPTNLRDAETIASDGDALMELEMPLDVERKEIALAGGAASSANGRVAGRVLGGWNGETPIADATVTLWRSRARNPREHESRTDADGNFVMEDVTFAYWFAEMTAAGHRSVRLVVPVTPEDPTAAPVARLPFWRDVGVNLLDSTGPVANVEQIGLRSAFRAALTLGIGPRGARAESDLKRRRKLGSFRGLDMLGAKDSASWRLKAFTEHGDWLHVLLGPQVVASHPLEDVKGTIEIPVDPQAIRDALTRASVRVVSGAGAPIAGARVEFLFDGQTIEDVTADANGVAVVHDVPHVGLMARARSPRHVPDILPVDGGGELVVIRLAPGWSISGRVEAPKREPDPSVPEEERPELQENVALWRVDPESERLGSRVQKVELHEGRFQFDAVRSGTYVLSCAADTDGNLRRDQILSSPPSHVVVLQVTDHEWTDVVVPWVHEVQLREAMQHKRITGRKGGFSSRKEGGGR